MAEFYDYKVSGHDCVGDGGEAAFVGVAACGTPGHGVIDDG